MTSMWFALAMLVSVRIAPDAAGVKFSQPQIAVANDLVALTFGSANTIYFSGSRDQGRTFSKPVVVAEIPSMMLGMHRGPRIAITSAGVIVITAPSGQNIMAWLSKDDGRHWAAGGRVNDVPASGPEGLHALVGGPKGFLFSAWLDTRENKRNQLYGSSSTDGGMTWLKNVRVYASPDGKICECCHPSLAISSTGQIIAMWRNDLSGARDLYFATSSDGGKTFAGVSKLGQGTWPLNICPMDGGSVAVDTKGNITSVWRRNDTVFLSTPGRPEVALGIGKDAALAVNSQGVYAIWSSGAGLRAKVPDGSRPIVLAVDGAFASVAGTGSVFAAWESQGAIAVTRLDKQ